MKMKFLGMAVIGALSVSTIACSKKEKTTSNSQSVPVGEHGDWVIHELNEVAGANDLFMQDQGLTIDFRDGKKVLKIGNLELPFEDNVFKLDNGRKVEITSYKSDKDGEVAVLTLLNPSPSGEDSTDRYVSAIATLKRPVKAEAAPIAETEEKTEKELTPAPTDGETDPSLED